MEYTKLRYNKIALYTRKLWTTKKLKSRAYNDVGLDFLDFLEIVWRALVRLGPICLAVRRVAIVGRLPRRT